MKKQGDVYLKLISISVAVLLAVYPLTAMFREAEMDYTTEPVTYCEVGDGITVSGFVVRSEELIYSSMPLVSVERAEGEWIGGGEQVATGCEDAATMEAVGWLRELELQQTALQKAQTEDTANLRQEIDTLLLNQGEQPDPDMAQQLKARLLSLTAKDGQALRNRIFAIQEQLETLRQTLQGRLTELRVSNGGYFSAKTDGYEHILTPERLDRLMPRELDKLSLTAPASLGASVIGKLCMGQEWYFVAAVNSAWADKLSEGQTLTVALERREPFEMKLCRISAEESGRRLLVLSADRLLQDFTALRKAEGTLTSDAQEGLRIPKDSVYFIDGAAGVYVLQDTKARWKRIEVLQNLEQELLVRWDYKDTNSLQPGDRVILTSEEIRDGMVLR